MVAKVQDSIGKAYILIAISDKVMRWLATSADLVCTVSVPCIHSLELILRLFAANRRRDLVNRDPVSILIDLKSKKADFNFEVGYIVKGDFQVLIQLLYRMY